MKGTRAAVGLSEAGVAFSLVGRGKSRTVETARRAIGRGGRDAVALCTLRASGRALDDRQRADGRPSLAPSVSLNLRLNYRKTLEERAKDRARGFEISDG